LSLDGFENALSDPSTNKFTTAPYSFVACSAPVISFLSVSSVPCGGLSATVTHRVQGNLYFSPKAYSIALPHSSDQKIVGAMSRPIGSVTDLWLSANPLTVREIGRLGQKATRLCWDAAGNHAS